ncbi:MAG: hypothetical protein NC131_01145 [Roseburia sp.]|nr:hypothetical protein [Roseburia sp.]
MTDKRLVGVRNTTSQTVLAGGQINIGNVYRRYCRKNACGIPTFAVTANGITIQQSGIYHITATAVGSGTVAGVAIIQANENGVAIPAALSAQTITTATTELRTFVLDFYVLVDKDCVLGQESVSADTITFTNTGVGATLTAFTVNVEKVV